MKPISMDSRKRIVKAYDAGEEIGQEIAPRFKVSVPMVKKLESQRKKIGSLAPQAHRCGRKPLFEQKDLLWLNKTVDKQPDITLEDLRTKSSKACCHMTIFRALRQLKTSYKRNP
jgi:transposase